MINCPEDTIQFDKRSGKDRRSNKIPGIKSLFVYGRRKKIRRQDDKYRIAYFDQYSSALFVVIISILFLNIIDALLTLFLIDHGATEINPIMAYFLNFGPLTFMSVKYFLVSFSIIVLLIFNNVFLLERKIFTRSFFSYTIGMFLIVIGWQLFLTFHIIY
jgi:K+-sensing histidine kinase KdpD